MTVGLQKGMGQSLKKNIVNQNQKCLENGGKVKQVGAASKRLLFWNEEDHYLKGEIRNAVLLIINYKIFFLPLFFFTKRLPNKIISSVMRTGII